MLQIDGFWVFWRLMQRGAMSREMVRFSLLCRRLKCCKQSIYWRKKQLFNGCIADTCFSECFLHVAYSTGNRVVESMHYYNSTFFTDIHAVFCFRASGIHIVWMICPRWYWYTCRLFYVFHSINCLMFDEFSVVGWYNTSVLSVHVTVILLYFLSRMWPLYMATHG